MIYATGDVVIFFKKDLVVSSKTPIRVITKMKNMFKLYHMDIESDYAGGRPSITKISKVFKVGKKLQKTRDSDGELSEALEPTSRERKESEDFNQ